MSPQADARHRGLRAARLVADALKAAGWEVEQRPEQQGHLGDLQVRRDDLEYLVEIKVASEGRADRLIPLWSQAYLQAAHSLGKVGRALVVVVVPKVSPIVARQVLDFAEKHAPGAGAAVMDFAGGRWFHGEGLIGLNVDKAEWDRRIPAVREHAADLFSDLNQWLLKVLLAPGIPEPFLSAPRQKYHQAAALAAVADVSAMSVSRFLRQLEQQGFLDKSGQGFALVRRADLFERWKAWSLVRRVREKPMRFIAPGAHEKGIHRLAHQHRAALGLFAGADALGLGHVSGVPAHLYVRQFDEHEISKWKGVAPADPHEVPAFIVRQPPSPESIFRGAVPVGDVLVSDAIQLWLDVSSHPSRGPEQARKIYNRVIAPLFEGGALDG